MTRNRSQSKSILKFHLFLMLLLAIPSCRLRKENTDLYQAAGRSIKTKARNYAYECAQVTEVVTVTQANLQNGFEIKLRRNVSYQDASNNKLDKTYDGSIKFSLNEIKEAPTNSLKKVLDIDLLSSKPEKIGTGKVLMREILDIAEKQNIELIRVPVAAPEAHGFYAKLGFHPSQQWIKDHEAVLEQMWLDYTERISDFNNLSEIEKWHKKSDFFALNIPAWEVQIPVLQATLADIVYKNP